MAKIKKSKKAAAVDAEYAARAIVYPRFIKLIGEVLKETEGGMWFATKRPRSKKFVKSFFPWSSIHYVYGAPGSGWGAEICLTRDSTDHPIVAPFSGQIVGYSDNGRVTKIKDDNGDIHYHNSTSQFIGFTFIADSDESSAPKGKSVDSEEGDDGNEEENEVEDKPKKKKKKVKVKKKKSSGFDD